MGSNIPAGTEGSPTPRTVVPQLPPPKYGTRITVLSIDGGGIRGLIPSVIVAKLEEMLQKIDKDPEARIVDYFDVIAGTSTGALLTACLVTPNKKNPARPLKAAKEITEFYRQEGPKIFHPRDGPLYRFGNWITRGVLANVPFLKHILIGGPTYDGQHLSCLVTPDKKKPTRPVYAAKDITEFYRQEGPKIFPPRKQFSNCIRKTMGLLANVPFFIHILFGGPTYDGQQLRNTIMDLTEGVKFDDALTAVVVPTFDVQKMSTRIFLSTPNFDNHNRNSAGTMLSDLLIGTSAAPTFFPAHPAPIHRSAGETPDAHLIDGGVAANNPTMLAISYAIKKMLYENPHYPRAREFNYRNAVVISLGTGDVKHEAMGKYTATDCAKWSAVDWIYNRTNKHKPLLDFFSSANNHLVGFYTAAFLQSHHCHDYLRIQPTVEGRTALMDDATEANINELIRIGEEVLEKTVCDVDFSTGKYQTTTGGPTNKQKLRSLAEILSKERQARLRNYANRDNTASSSSVE